MTYDFADLQNENLYLNIDNNSKIIKEIMLEQSCHRGRIDKAKDYYNNSIVDYNQFIKLIAQIIKELKLTNNSIALSILLRKLIFNGYFSKDTSFKADSKESFYDVESFEGMDIIDGKGCCRHLASFYHAIFTEIGNYSQIFPCYLGNIDCTLSEAFVNPANHAANLIKNDGLIYVYNSFTNGILRPIDKFTVEKIVDYENYIPTKYYYKPSAGVMTCSFNFDEAMNIMKLLEEDSKRDHIDYAKYQEIKKEANAIFMKNNSLFEDLKSESKKYTKKISDGMKQAYRDVIDDYYC